MIGDTIPKDILERIIKESINFDAPVVQVEKGIYSLELWHGPTLAFKDFSDRFMARLISYFLEGEDVNLQILVATSGDT